MAGSGPRKALEIVGEMLISFRAAEGLSVEEAAEDAEIEVERLARAENAEIALSEEELQRLADAYGIPVTAFFGGKTTPLAYLAGA